MAENVRGLTDWDGGIQFEACQADLETEGYQVQSFVLPACAVNNAPHRRDRVWIVAHAPHNGCGRGAVKDVKTNDAGGYYRENKKGEKWGVKLRDVVESGLLATPTATDWKGAYAPEAMVSKDGIDRSLLSRERVHTHGPRLEARRWDDFNCPPYLWKK